MLRKTPFSKFVLDQTIVEASQSIKSFLSESAPYSQRVSRYLSKVRIHTSGFFAAMNCGVTRTQFLEYSKETKIREILAEKYSVNFIDDFSDIVSEDSKKALILAKNSEGYGNSQAIHDLLLISCCRKKRPRRINSFRDAKWWVLTNDKKLTYWNQSLSQVFQECITEVQLSNLLWLQAKKSNREGLTNTIMALAAKLSTTAHDISAFAENIEAYCSANAEKPDLLDKISLVFASSAITDEDIKKVNANVDEFGTLIEEKAEEIIAYHYEQRSEYDAANLAKAVLNTENKALKEKLEQNKAESKKAITLRDIQDSERIIEQSEERQRQIKDVLALYKKMHAPVGRKIALIFLVLLLAGTTVVCHFFYKPIVNWLKEEIAQSGVFWNLLSIGALGFVVSVVYYIAVTVVLGTPLKPAEAFDALRNKWIMVICRNHVIEKHYNTELATEDLAILLSQEMRVVEEERRKLTVFRQELKKLESMLAE